MTAERQNNLKFYPSCEFEEKKKTCMLNRHYIAKTYFFCVALTVCTQQQTYNTINIVIHKQMTLVYWFLLMNQYKRDL